MVADGGNALRNAARVTAGQPLAFGGAHARGRRQTRRCAGLAVVATLAQAASAAYCLESQRSFRHPNEYYTAGEEPDGVVQP